MPTIVIPTALRTYTENQTSLRVEASTVGEAIQQLVERFPKLSRTCSTRRDACAASSTSIWAMRMCATSKGWTHRSKSRMS